LHLIVAIFCSSVGWGVVHHDPTMMGWWLDASSTSTARVHRTSSPSCLQLRPTQMHHIFAVAIPFLSINY
jgi:hypothetical protein